MYAVGGGKPGAGAVGSRYIASLRLAHTYGTDVITVRRGHEAEHKITSTPKKKSFHQKIDTNRKITINISRILKI